MLQCHVPSNRFSTPPKGEVVAIYATAFNRATWSDERVKLDYIDTFTSRDDRRPTKWAYVHTLDIKGFCYRVPIDCLRNVSIWYETEVQQ